MAVDKTNLPAGLLCVEDPALIFDRLSPRVRSCFSAEESGSQSADTHPVCDRNAVLRRPMPESKRVLGAAAMNADDCRLS
jgi:hypothetical protein